MQHQLRALRKANGKRGFAYFMEMGTGKTWTILAEAERMYAAGTIDAIFVLAPKGVHTNWTRIEIPKHLEVPHIAACYFSGGTKKNKAEVERVFAPREHGEVPPLRILAMNIDAIATADGFKLAVAFLNSTKAMFVIDESDRIKGHNSIRTQRTLRLVEKAAAVRIASGLPILQGPMDMFSQMEAIGSGLLGTTSYRAFVAEYAELLPDNHGLMRHIKDRAPPNSRPQVIAKNADGTPRYRNLEKLQRLIEPHSFRILLNECTDLPEKIFRQTYFELAPKQRAAYDKLENELRIDMNGETNVINALASIGKLQQITSGFVNLEGVPHLVATDENPRMELLLETFKDIPRKSVIIWAHFREEIRQIAEAIEKMGRTVVQYHGGVKDKDRSIAVDKFQNGEAEYFLGQPQSGGIGLTLTAAEYVIYYSNSFRLGVRKQSEARAHRIGTTKSVVYIDLVARDTIDEPIARSLQRKESVAKAVMGDRQLSLPAGVEDNSTLELQES